MRNSQFWDVCNGSSLRQDVAEFIESTPQLSHFKKEDYYAVEDAIVEFIERNRQKLHDEVEHECERDDIASDVLDGATSELQELFYQRFPAQFLDEIIRDIEKELGNNDAYWDAYWQSIHSVLDKYKDYFAAWRAAPACTLTLLPPKEWLKNQGGQQQ